MELVLELTQQEHPSDTYVFTVKMEILLEAKSIKLYDSLLQAGNSCQGESSLKGILPNHRSVLTDPKMDVVIPDFSSAMSIQSHILIHYQQIQRHHDNAVMVQKSMSMSVRRSQHHKDTTYHMLIIGDYIRLVISRKPKDHIQRQARWNNAKDHYTKYKDIIKDYELEQMINSKTAKLQLVFSGVTSLRGRLGKLIQKLLLNQNCMSYLVRAYYSISPTRSKAIEYIISIGSFVKALVLNHYVLVRKI
nr:hypothetical protein [Tanacetum cinerariifolium]